MDMDDTGDAAASSVVAQRWEPASRRGNRWFGIAIGVLAGVAAIALAIAWIRGWRPPAGGPPKPVPTAADFKKGATHCMQVGDLDCAEFNWTEYVRQRPLDGRAIASLGMVQNMRDKHAEAVQQFQKSIEMGEGTYDLFAYYADSLTKLGRIDDAIDWSYRALSIVPALVDVRGNLAKLLVNRQRPHEALALLQAYDVDAQAHGHPPYFTGQRISIENLLRGAPAGQGAAASAPPRPLRLTRIGDHFYAPVSIGEAPSTAFVVDTGAFRTTMSRSLLQASKIAYRVTEPSLPVRNADGHRSLAQGVVIASLRVGPFELQNVPAVVCDACVALLGQSALSLFDLQSSKVQGVEFLTLTRR